MFVDNNAPVPMDEDTQMGPPPVSATRLFDTDDNIVAGSSNTAPTSHPRPKHTDAQKEIIRLKAIIRDLETQLIIHKSDHEDQMEKVQTNFMRDLRDRMERAESRIGGFDLHLAPIHKAIARHEKSIKAVEWEVNAKGKELDAVKESMDLVDKRLEKMSVSTRILAHRSFDIDTL